MRTWLVDAGSRQTIYMYTHQWSSDSTAFLPGWSTCLRHIRRGRRFKAIVVRVQTPGVRIHRSVSVATEIETPSGIAPVTSFPKILESPGEELDAGTEPTRLVNSLEQSNRDVPHSRWLNLYVPWNSGSQRQCSWTAMGALRIPQIQTRPISAHLARAAHQRFERPFKTLTYKSGAWKEARCMERTAAAPSGATVAPQALPPYLPGQR